MAPPLTPLPPPPKVKRFGPVTPQLAYSDPRFADDPSYVLVLSECELCGGIIQVPAPKDVIKNSELPVVPLTYVHGPPENRHAIMVHLDHDFQVRRFRYSYLVEWQPEYVHSILFFLRGIY